jgi:hypothetical protein
MVRGTVEEALKRDAGRCGRSMREIRRRTRVVGASPDGRQCLNLAAVWLRHIAGTQ